MPTSELLRLACLVFAAVTFVVVGDTAGKLLTQSGVSPVIVAWTRFGIAALILLPFSGLTRDELPSIRDWRVLIRGVLLATGVFFILNALKTEPIANVFGAFFIGPIVSYALAVAFLGEKPSRERTILLVLGFAGVMLVVKPGFGASMGMLFALIAGVFYGAYLAATRIAAEVYRPRFLLISQLLVGALVLTPLGLATELPQLDIRVSLLILLSAFGSALGNFLLVLANKICEASLIAPLVYSQLISATVLGVVVFGDWPDLLSLVGLLLIALSGFGSLRSYQKTKREQNAG